MENDKETKPDDKEPDKCREIILNQGFIQALKEGISVAFKTYADYQIYGAVAEDLYKEIELTDEEFNRIIQQTQTQKELIQALKNDCKSALQMCFNLGVDDDLIEKICLIYIKSAYLPYCDLLAELKTIEEKIVSSLSKESPAIKIQTISTENSINKP